jgi:hypothetical protein
MPAPQASPAWRTLADAGSAGVAGMRQPSVAPCSMQTARQPSGSTCTFIRRRQDGQNRGGSSARAARQPAWSATAMSPPQRSQYDAVITMLPTEP